MSEDRQTNFYFLHVFWSLIPDCRRTLCWHSLQHPCLWPRRESHHQVQGQSNVKHNDGNTYLKWVQQKPGKAPTVLIYQVFNLKSGVPACCSGRGSNRIFTLTISSVKAEDVVDYYCFQDSFYFPPTVKQNQTKTSLIREAQLSPLFPLLQRCLLRYSLWDWLGEGDSATLASLLFLVHKSLSPNSAPLHRSWPRILSLLPSALWGFLQYSSPIPLAARPVLVPTTGSAVPLRLLPIYIAYILYVHSCLNSSLTLVSLRTEIVFWSYFAYLVPTTVPDI